MVRNCLPHLQVGGWGGGGARCRILAVLESGFKEYCSILLREAVSFHYLCGKLFTVVILRGSSENETKTLKQDQKQKMAMSYL